VIEKQQCHIRKLKSKDSHGIFLRGGDIARLLGILLAVLDNDQSHDILKLIISKGEKGQLVVKTVD